MSYGGFTSVQLKKPQRSFFDMSHDKKLTLRAGQLVPVMIAESIPGDTWTYSAQVLMRLMALLAPVYARFRVTLHCFFVPNRLLWSEWEDFITTGRLGLGVSEPQPIPPYFRIEQALNLSGTVLENGRLADYLGVPEILDSSIATWDQETMDAMPFQAYQLIWYEYYRDRNYYADDVILDILPSGDISGDPLFGQIFSLRRRDWSKNDYFVSALPFTQRGSDVLIPMTADVTYLNTTEAVDANTGNPVGALEVRMRAYTDGLLYSTDSTSPDQPVAPLRIENIEDISNSSVTINDLRSALRLQEWLERNAVGGGRYTETIQAHFGVRPQDSRLQRPEYLGGGILPVKIAEVVNTAFSENEAAEVVPAGNLAGHGISYGNNGGFKYYCHEHGFIMAIMSVTSVASYQQGLPRMFKRSSFLDYPWPLMANLGEQEVHDWEIYCNPASMTQTDGEYPLFGYQSRYADWKFISSTSHGDFRDTLLHWTQTRTFASQPVLGATFVNIEDTLQDRIFAVEGNNFLAYVFNKMSVSRALPYFGTPML